ncbi:TPA: hypothetical protein DIV48_02170 [Candidatus Kaiserbacteria bacterium]|nr:MAG: hypothetical protein UY93_C0001G0047 [Parcubacteria group bacterium GW2011_GWA1_56_13]KKW46971.1 MAG: hypothetical protein UY97_C0001G0028 [Parcubacteria group bacterium GW2011_GWB1_57_6]HCR52433.1 hypothetical protein [Candidatus Kaiserbacteria bacterium]
MKQGFTLIEAVVVMSVSVVVLMALVNLFFVFNSMYGYQQAFIATAGSSGAALNALEAAVLPADRVLASHAFSGTSYASGSTTLVLSLPAFNGSGAIVESAKDYVVFYASSTEFYRLVLADAQSVRVSGLTRLSGTLDAVSFTYDDADFSQVTNVIADIQTRAQYKEQTVQSRVREQLYLRNFSP